MDLVEEHDDYDPSSAYGFSPDALSPEEEQALAGKTLAPGDDDELVPQEDAW